MKLRGSIGMDAVFSIILVLMMLVFLEGTSKNIVTISKKVEKKQDIKRILIDEAKKKKV